MADVYVCRLAKTELDATVGGEAGWTSIRRKRDEVTDRPHGECVLLAKVLTRFMIDHERSGVGGTVRWWAAVGHAGTAWFKVVLDVRSREACRGRRG